MATVQSNVLKFALRANSFTKSGVKFTLANIGTLDGSRLTAQRLLDIYNDARFVLFNALLETKSKKEFDRLVSGTLNNASIVFSVSGSYVVATKPTGYISLASLIDASSVPIYVLPNEQLQELRAGNPDFTLSATNLYAFETGTQFKIPSASYGAGTGTIDYYGITNWTIANVTAGTAVEVFSGDIEPILIEIANALANEQSNADASALAKMLLNKKG